MKSWLIRFSKIQARRTTLPSVASCWPLLVCLGCTTGLQELSRRSSDDGTPPRGAATETPVQLPGPEVVPAPPGPVRDDSTSQLIARARQHAAAAQWDLAQTALDRAYRMTPRDPAITETKARFLFSQRKYAEAESWAQRTLLLLPAEQYLARAGVLELIEASRRELGRVEDANKAHQQRDEILRASGEGLPN